MLEHSKSVGNRWNLILKFNYVLERKDGTTICWITAIKLI